MQRTEFFVSLGHILPFDPTNNPKNQNFEKNKKMPEDTIISHLSITTYDHMMYGFWDTEHDRQNFLLFWAIFYPFIPLKAQKIKILNKCKKHLEMLLFYKCVP